MKRQTTLIVCLEDSLSLKIFFHKREIIAFYHYNFRIMNKIYALQGASMILKKNLLQSFLEKT